MPLLLLGGAPPSSKMRRRRSPRAQESLVGGLLKLPDVLITDDDDVGALVDGTEIELLPIESA